MISAAFTYLSAQFGWRVDVVLSGSMEPELKTGAIVVTRPVAPESVTIGDIITFHTSFTNEIPVTHRVIEIGTNTPVTFRTKGDAADTRDPFTVPSRNLIGQVWFSIPYAGFIISFIKTSTGFYTTIVFPAVILLVLYARTVALEVRVYRTNKAGDAVR